jgi:Mg/Co/Ni transporter MgtE
MDWFAAGLPREGSAASRDTIGDRVHADVPTASPGEAAYGLAERLGDRDVGVVVNDDRVVLGVVTAPMLAAADGQPIAHVMKEAPVTHRPDTSTDEVVDWLGKQDMQTYVVVTDPEGHLLGAAHRNDIDERRGA